MKKKTVLITGGFGFLGGRLAQHLSDNYNVILGSRVNQSTPDWLHTTEIKKITKINWDSEVSLNDACKKIDIVIHASGLNAQECANNPEKALLVNGVFTQNLVKAAVNQGVKKIIYLSTAHVYSSNLTGAISEDMPTTNKHPYATTHVVGEDAVLLAANQGIIEGSIVRIANAFGSPVSKDVKCWMLLVNDLCKQAITETSLTLYSDSEMVRDFVTINDFCAAMEFLIEDKGTGNVVHIGSGKSCTIGEMASKIQKNCLSVLEFKPSIIFKKESTGEKGPLDFKTNYLNAKGFMFTNDFDTEIKKLIHFCKQNFSKN